MNCNNIKNKIEVSIIEKADLSIETVEHIKSCSDCHTYYESEKSLAKMISEELKSVPIIVPQTDFLLNRTKPRRMIPWLIPLLSASAAVLLIAITIFVVIKQQRIKVQDINNQDENNNITADTLEVQKFELSDGSSLIASHGCKLLINEIERQVIMKQPGDLYVKVEENQNKPFKIITPAGNIIARGTEFSVRVDEGEKNNQLNEGVFSVLVYVLNGTVELTTPMGNAVGNSGYTLYAEDGSAPVRNYSW